MNWKLMFIVLAILLCAMPIFAQGTAPNNGGGGTTNWIAIASGFRWQSLQPAAAWEWAELLGALPKEWRATRERHPLSVGALILGLVLIESLALYVIVIIFVKVV